MKKSTVYQLSLWICIGFLALGYIFQGTENKFPGNFMLGFGYAAALNLLFSGLKDVFSNEKIKLNERIMWVTGFVFILPVAAVLYFPAYRKRNG